MNISELIRDTIVGLCRANGPYNGQVEIDGIICISGPKEGQQLVIKVHESLEGFVREGVGSWSSKRAVHGDLGDLWSTPTKPETLTSRLPSVVLNMEQESPRTSLDVRAAEDGRSKVRFSTSDDSPETRADKNCLSTSRECKLCFKALPEHESMESHNETCHDLFTCQSCFKTFTSRSNLDRHSRLHTGQRPYGCTVCDKAFSRKDHLTNHMTKHAFKCGSCPKKFGDCGSLASHFAYEHGTSLTHVCPPCNEGFGNSAAYEDHLSSHPECRSNDPCKTVFFPPDEQKRSFPCPICPFSASDALSFYRHRLSHMFDNKSQCSCLFCNKPFGDIKSFMEHSMEHQNTMASQTLHINWLQHFSNHYHSLLTSSNLEAYHGHHDVPQVSSDHKAEPSDKRGGRSTGNPEGRERQERKLKRKQEHSSFADPGGSYFGRKGSDGAAISLLSASTPIKPKRMTPGRHLSEPAGLPADRYVADGLGERSSEVTPMNLKVERGFEGCEGHGSEPQQCGVCQRWFGCFDTLDCHCLEEHNRSACMFCSKTFAQRANRDRHLCLHTGKKPYACSDCDERFSRGDKLKMHRIKAHGAVYPARIRDNDSGSWSTGSTLKNRDQVSPGLEGDVFEGARSASSEGTPPSENAPMSSGGDDEETERPI